MGILKFEVGKFYRWIGTDQRYNQALASHAQMKPMLDGQPRRCVHVGRRILSVEFEGIEGGTWHWYGLEFFEECGVRNEDAEPYPGFFAQGVRHGH